MKKREIGVKEGGIGSRTKRDALMPQSAEKSRSVYTEKGIYALGVDPGLAGAFVITDGAETCESFHMPIAGGEKDRAVDFDGVLALLRKIIDRFGRVHVFLERAVPMAMGSKGAFSYGRGFEALVIAIKICDLPMTMVEPGKWTKEMCEGIRTDLRAKARSLIAVRRLYPRLVRTLPTKPKGGLYDGPVDGLLLAGYGLRRLGMVGASTPNIVVPRDEIGDFF